MTSVSEAAATCRVIRSIEEYQGKQGPTYAGGVSAEIAAEIGERFGKALRAPVMRVASADVPVPFSPPLEDAYRPDAARIVSAVRQLLR